MAEDTARLNAAFEAVDKATDLPGVRLYRDAEAPPDPGSKTFEIGLVLAGAISAGAYSAGVMDFLIEALDAWEFAKQRNEHVPMHRVRISVMAGASAGSMTAAIAAAALQYKFPHISSQEIPPDTTGNPFYDSWVKEIDISKLLDDSDLRQSPVLQSALDSTCLQEITDSALNIGESQNSTIENADRPYLGQYVRYIFTQGSLRGIPYFIEMDGPNKGGLSMNLHKNFRSFSVGYGDPVNEPVPHRPDDLVLDGSIRKKTGNENWQELGNAALGSGAFPVGLKPRHEKRRITDLFYRYVVVPNAEPADTKAIYDAPLSGFRPVTVEATTVLHITEAVRLLPNVSYPQPDIYDEYVVDGGTMDNEPLDMARTEMAGLLGSNERDGAKAVRALIMIDPFPDSAADKPPAPKPGPLNLIGAIVGLLGAWKSQCRFNPVDLALAADQSVYSRFLISPSPWTRSEDNAQSIACGSLGGFGGFLSVHFRHHDYLLGRRNCQRFLSEHFTLPENNPLFKSPGGAFDQRNKVRANKEVCIIPLIHGKTAEPLLDPEWPATPAAVVNLDALRDQIDHRIRNVSMAALELLGVSGVTLLAARAGVYLLRDHINDIILRMVKNDLEERHLLTTGPCATVLSRIRKLFG